MTKKQLIQLITLVSISIILNVVLYSKAGFGLRLSSNNPLLSAFLVTEIVGNIMIFIYIAYEILIKAQTTQIYDTKTFLKEKDYIEALEDCKSKKTFIKQIEKAQKQIDRIEEKYKTIEVILLQHFETGSMTYEKFIGTVNLIKELFFNNLKKMINRISIFNEEEYKEAKENNSYLEIFQEHIKYVNEMIESNNAILAKLDSLILEISKLNDGEEEKFEHLQIMQELDDLIKKTKLYN